MKENETNSKAKNAYNTAYQKKNYKKMNVLCKPEIFDKIESFCKDMEISKAKFVQLACLYVINNDLFSEIVQEK